MEAIYDFFAFYGDLVSRCVDQLLNSTLGRWLMEWFAKPSAFMVATLLVLALVVALLLIHRRRIQTFKSAKQAYLSTLKDCSVQLFKSQRPAPKDAGPDIETNGLGVFRSPHDERSHENIPTSSNDRLIGWTIRRQLCVVRVDKCESVGIAELQLKRQAVQRGANALLNLRFLVVNGSYSAEADAVTAMALEESELVPTALPTATITVNKPLAEPQPRVR